MNTNKIITNKFLSMATTAVIGLAVLTGSLFAQSQVYVNGYYKSNGTYVKPHVRTSPDSNPYNNYSYPGNYNPNTGRVTTGSKSTYLKNYYNNSSSSSSSSYSGYNSNSSYYNNSNSLYNYDYNSNSSIWD
tara:strand:- start:70 stop:462 length:393 start_codon:yes stop_codon:yes gene_type:complete